METNNETYQGSEREFLRSIIEKAKSVLVREHVFAVAEINPTIEVELSYSELETILDLLNDTPK